MTTRPALPSAMVAALWAPAALAADPALAPGRDPGGTAIAVVAPGFDYRRPELARVLARDGEGEAIAFDAVDGDARPFGTTEDDTAFAVAAARDGSVRIVLVRADLDDPASLAKAIAFAVATPARLVLLPLREQSRKALRVIGAAAKRFEGTLFVASLPELAASEKDLANAEPNLVLVDAGKDALAAAKFVAAALDCNQELSGASGAELARALSARRERPAPGCKPKTSESDE